MEPLDPLAIGYAICDESSDLVKLLVIGYRANGSTFTLDSGLTADEAKKMARDFISWVDMCLGRELERETQSGA